MIFAMIVLGLFAWVGISIWWVIRHAGCDTPPKETWWNAVQLMPVIVILWVVEQARKAKKYGVK